MAKNEIHFFNSKWGKGVAWYENQFKDWNGEQLIGEKTPAYLHTPEVPERISDTISDIKLIFILRDPVSRAYSYYWLLRRFGDVSESFEKAVWQRDYLERGKYVKHIERYLEFFERPFPS